jgi:glycosyltransferase involved in cell wall biosynthesis
MTRRARLAVIADFEEENWPSMDLVAEMLSETVRGEEFDVVLVRPTMIRRFSDKGDTRSRRYTADRFVNRLREYPRALRRSRDAFDLFHIADHSYSHLVHVLPAHRTVVTCHDLDTFRSVLDPLGEPRSWPFRLMTRRILSGFRKAARIACDSEGTRAAILRYGIVPRERLLLAPLGLHPDFLCEGDVEADRDADALLGPKRADALDVLHVGGTTPRKRIDFLLRVCRSVIEHAPTLRLIRVGGELTREQEALAGALGMERTIVSLPRLSRRQVAAVYRRAHVVVLPSEREGFGLPVLEALACGTPVVASDLPELRQTGGLVATYCPIGDLDAWVSAVLDVLRARRSPDPLVDLERQQRVTHARKFGWTDYARTTIEMYRAVLAETDR